MAKRSPAHKAAEARYAEKSAIVSIRLTPKELEVFDKAKGDLTRSAFLKAILKSSIKLD